MAFPEPLRTTAASIISAENPNNLKPAELRGVGHLFRELSHTPTGNTLSNSGARSSLLFLVAVPNYFSPDDFLLFCVSYLPKFTEILFIRNDGVEDRYSVLIRFENQLSANGFYLNFNGKKFKPFEVEVCHMYFVQSVQYTMSAEIATTPPEFAELPTCPVCLERLDYDTSGIQSTPCGHSFQCSCVSKWTNLSCLVCQLCQQRDEKPACAVCGILNNLWVCLICGFVGCGRYENGHAIGHWSDKQHRFTIGGVEKREIWDYVGKKYVHRLNQSKVDDKSVMKVDDKSVMMSSHCSLVGECDTCRCDGVSELDGALFGSKVEAMASGQGQTSQTERRNHFTWLHRNYKRNPNHDLLQHLNAMEKIYRGAKANGYQFHRDEIVYHLHRTLTPYWRQFIKGIEETFDYQTSPNILLQCIRERWRVNREDGRETNKILDYEPNLDNVITIPEVDYEGNYVEDNPDENYSSLSYLVVDLKPTSEGKYEENQGEGKYEGTGKNY